MTKIADTARYTPEPGDRLTQNGETLIAIELRPNTVLVLGADRKSWEVPAAIITYGMAREEQTHFDAFQEEVVFAIGEGTFTSLEAL